MKKIFLGLLILCSCAPKEKIEPPPSPTVVDEKVNRIVYEGIIKTEYAEGPIELFLDEAQPGLTSSFSINGNFVEDQIFNMGRGEYTMLSGAEGNEVILQLHGSVMSHKIKRDPKNGSVTSFSPDVHELDLFFITEGGNKLILVDEDFDRISDDDRYTLYRRSRLFTVEGYITMEDRYTEFFEQNTRENWIVAPLGVYNDVQKIYDSLVTEKSEGMFLKAIAYSVESDSIYNEPRQNYITHGIGGEFLVIKSILEMKKSEAFTNKENTADSN